MRSRVTLDLAALRRAAREAETVLRRERLERTPEERRKLYHPEERRTRHDPG